ncbi:MAG TPA: TetR/AcrR family transcriptional regulator, partial [Acidimicrobiales bacterium]|nr:TetR/AcrR family transcriptional regulator [Acidimicrobiales bacterium]
MSLPGTRPARTPERALRSGHHGLSRETVASTQRDRIIDAFVQVAAERGYQRTTVVAVCKQAGVSSKTFYVHFADKEDCFLAAYDLGMDQLLGEVRQVCAAGDTWPDRLAAGLSRLLSELAAAPAFARMAVVEVNAAGPAAIDRLTAALRACQAFFADAPWDSRLPDVKEGLVSAVIGGVYTRIRAAVVSGDAAHLPDALAELRYFSLLPFVGRDAAAEGLVGQAGDPAPGGAQGAPLGPTDPAL